MLSTLLDISRVSLRAVKVHVVVAEVVAFVRVLTFLLASFPVSQMIEHSEHSTRELEIPDDALCQKQSRHKTG